MITNPTATYDSSKKLASLYLKRRGEQIVTKTKTQELRPALPVNTQPNHVLPLAHFGAISDVCDGGAVRTDHHNAGERSVGALNNTTWGPTMHMLVVDGKAHHRSGNFHSRHIGVNQGKLFNGIDKQSRAGMRVVFDVTN
jgi:hypothetical protein